MYNYLVINDTYHDTIPHIMTMRALAEYIRDRFPVGRSIGLRIYRILPCNDPQRMYPVRTILGSDHVHSVYLTNRFGHNMDEFTFTDKPAEI